MEPTSSRQSAAQPFYQALDQTYVTQQQMPRYTRSIVMRMLQQIGPLRLRPDAVALDFGAGLGTLAKIWAAEFPGRVQTLELDPHQQQILTGLGFETFSSIDDVAPGSLDIVYSSNVLEHIEDDVAALRAIHARLRPQGRLLLYVPALQMLWNEMDVAVGHFRRYSRSGLRQTVQAAGFQVDDIGYDDSLGVLAALAVKLFGFKYGSGLATDGNYATYDRLIYPLSTVFDRLGGRYLLGKNLYLAATKR
jgi:SAM-dependent methyltransferase